MSTLPENEHLLDLPGGGVLHYAASGNPSSPNVVMFFHGVFSIGTATHTPSAFSKRDVHFIAPTLPGWGESSPTPSGTPFHTYLYQIVTTLITTVHPDIENLRLYISGGSMGTVIAQMLYGVPYDAFPLGRHIVGMLLLNPFSPPRVHTKYRQCLSFPNYLMVGPPGYWLPFKLIPRLAKMGMQSKMDTREHAEQFIREFAFTNLTPGERAAFEKWKVQRNVKDGEEAKEMGACVYRSVEKSWKGFMEVPNIFQAGWGGYSPKELDEEHQKPVLIVVTQGDVETKKMGEWLGANLKNSRMRYEEGGHVGTLFVLDDIFEDFMAGIPA